MVRSRSLRSIARLPGAKQLPPLALVPAHKRTRTCTRARTRTSNPAVLRWDLYHLSSVMLDSYPFGGYTTSLEALSVGLPIVTLPHAMLAGNSSAGFLRAMGVTDTIVGSKAEYASMAVRVGTDTAC